MDDDFADLKRDFEAAAKWLGWVMATLFALAWASAVMGAPRAQSAAECSIAADMAVVARALAEEAIAPEKAETIMRRIYDVAASTRGEELMQAILETAYKERESAGRFAVRLNVLAREYLFN